MEYTNPATGITFIIATLAKTNININERATPKACKTKYQDLQLVILLRNDSFRGAFQLKIFPLRNTSKLAFRRN